MTNASESQIQGALTFIEDQLGKPYRFHFSKSDDYYSEDWYCSELVWAAFHHQGIDLDWDDNESVGTCILPVTLASYEHLTTILHYTDDEDEERYKTTITNNGATGHTHSCDGDTYTEEHDYEVYNYCYEKCRACGYERQAKEHDYIYTTVSSSVHEATCTDCGYTEEKPHTFRYTTRNATQHTKVCTDCGESITENHNYEGKIIDALQHSLECDCGATNGTQGHIWTSYGVGKVKCDFCGFIKALAPGEFIPIVKNKEDPEEETE